MNRARLALGCGLAVVASAGMAGARGDTAAASARGWAGVTDPVQARTDYQLKCQGCHRPDGGGDDHSNPPMRGVVARFLGVPGGREFIGRVPGVATVDLDDARLANLVNWTLHRFDPEHLPRDFRPYTADEIGALRAYPLRLERAETRARLVKAFDERG